MTYKEYKEKREKLLDAAEVALNESKMDEYNAKMDEVKKMDDEWEKIRDAAEEMANYNLKKEMIQTIEELEKNVKY